MLPLIHHLQNKRRHRRKPNVSIRKKSDCLKTFELNIVNIKAGYLYQTSWERFNPANSPNGCQNQDLDASGSFEVASDGNSDTSTVHQSDEIPFALERLWTN